MLTLTNICKDYTAGDTTVQALRDISLCLRDNEFVSILGPSGCGKTTLLNIIGGLDGYTAGDLAINGRSTKQFRDRDWDAYRNHAIGFVFQSYNLIPHQSVLSNVELALTLSGVSRAERRRRAKEALEKVGLADQMHKKPNQMSGGQMQRVAIARALVNNPDILLADEPTGALDSTTSVQIMELLKEIANDKLVIMVTHNPELAQTYSTRIVRLLDGEIVSDSNPCPLPVPTADAASKPKKSRRQKGDKTSMSFWTALTLSTNNLLTKKTRTFLTSFAGSIGIIGIALIMSLSSGINAYINTVQEDTLSSYPISLQAENVDVSTMLSTIAGIEDGSTAHGTDKVYANAVMYQLFNAMNTMETKENNLKAFKAYLENGNNDIMTHASAIQYTYGQTPTVFVKDIGGSIVQSDIEVMMKRISEENENMPTMPAAYENMMNTTGGGGFGGVKLWEQMLAGENGNLINPLLREQYDVIHGHWPEQYNELVLVVDEHNEVQDISLYALGLKTTDQLQQILKDALNGETVDETVQSWSYDDICNLTFKMVLPADCYRHDAAGDTYVDLTATDAGKKYLYDNGVDLKIVGIIRPNEDAVASMMTGSIGYTTALTDHIAEKNVETAALKAQLADKTVDIFTGLPFKTDDMQDLTPAEKGVDIKAYMQKLPIAEKAALYVKIQSTPSDAYVENTVKAQMQGMTRERIEQMMLTSYAEQMGVSTDTIKDYIDNMTDEELMDNVQEGLKNAVTEQYAAATKQQLEAVPAAALAGMLDAAIPTYDQQTLVTLYDTYMPPTVSEATLEQNLKKLGNIDKADPTAIHIYASTFADKDSISEAITAYNNTVDEKDQISYTDYIALMLSSITTIISVISYVLIAFVAISLVVSSIMIGIITYISVLERTREIGVLRAIGASKRDISRVFNAETLIVGFAAGAIGIGLTLLLCIPINAIIRALTDIQNIGAALPPVGGVILVLISMVLTFISGLIPARIAAKKDPVVALRSE